ncbi:thioredoxin family protein [Desulfitobacterium metallireducens]|uniref:Redox-active disulfide protein n=1 Tax=Desulfitobacterium metallireducens DSM 15288 TaxID=871968 RepID=W0E6A6_9FIRM|nr:thioredoxin family protein [Desulfitobacterium metallireducens]AHF06272.1 redox-active disulfide protein [Desulfitobacterium metallireducens DSM 15288]
MKVKILGTGCSKCKKLEEIAREAVADLGIDAEVEKVEDIAKIMSYGVMSTPALVINEKVKLAGKVPNKQQVIELLQTELS